MRHGVKTKKLGRDNKHRKAMLKNLATSILLKGLTENQLERQVRTTVAKAKAVRGLVDRLITYAKKGDLAAKRQVARFVQDKEAFQGLFQVLAPRYANRNGGYSRVLKLSNFRHGDNAEMAIVSLVEDELSKKKKVTKKIAKKVTTVKKETVSSNEKVKTSKKEEIVSSKKQDATQAETKTVASESAKVETEVVEQGSEKKTEEKPEEPKKD